MKTIRVLLGIAVVSFVATPVEAQLLPLVRVRIVAYAEVRRLDQ